MVLSRKKTRVFRVLAVMLGLLPVVVLELTLRGLNLPVQPPSVDPFVDLHNLKPLFEPVQNESENNDQTVAIGASRLNLFRPASFTVVKPKNTFRIFAVGGSTTQGEPYSTETAFPHWLGVSLEAAAPGTKFDVINCGGLSYASYRVLAILKEVLQYQPDLVVIYTGHNEYLERRSYEGYQRDSFGAQAVSWLEQLRVVQQARILVGRDGLRHQVGNRSRTELTREVDALLDYNGGLADYHRSDDWHQAVTAHFRWNLESMIRKCQLADVPVVLIQPVSNLASCPPMKFEVDPALPLADKDRFEAAWSRAREATSQETALAAAREALSIDPKHAGVNYLIGKLLLEQGKLGPARRHLVLAKDYDVCPLRTTTAIFETIAQVANWKQVPLVDSNQLLQNLSERGVVDSQWLVDHIHPSVQGHQVLGKAIAAKCIEKGIVPVTNSDWQLHLDDRFARDTTALGEHYFQRGKQRLEGLILWTQGRATKVRTRTD